MQKEELEGMEYEAVKKWAGANFDRLRAVAEARDYRPEWIGHQIAAHRAVTVSEAEVLVGMITSAGPFLSPRQRWIMRHRV